MTKIKKEFLFIGIAIIIVGLVIILSSKYIRFRRPAPPGITGSYSISNADRVYATQATRASLLKGMEDDGLVVHGGKVHDYDAAWDSLTYSFDSLPCGTEWVKPSIRFTKEKQNGLTVFYVLWVGGAPNYIDDTTVYLKLVRKYYECFEVVLKRYGVQIQ